MECPWSAHGVPVDSPLMGVDCAQSVVHRYDDTPDGKLDLAEFTELIRDIEAGVVRSQGRDHAYLACTCSPRRPPFHRYAAKGVTTPTQCPRVSRPPLTPLTKTIAAT